MGCPSCQKKEWFFTDPNNGEEVVRNSHYDAITARRQIPGAASASIQSRPKAKTT